MSRHTLYDEFSCLLIFLFWEDCIQKEVGSGTIADAQWHLQKLRGDCACIVP